MVTPAPTTAAPNLGTTASVGIKSGTYDRPFKPLLRRLYNSFGYSDASSSSSSGESSGESSPETSPLLAPTPGRGADKGGVDDDADVVDLEKLPQCWGHRGASAAFPENTLASFKQAIEDGAEGIESDVHISLDGTIVMFHDTYLNRTTNGKGLITKLKYKDGIDQLRTTKLPAQQICTLPELLDLLMQPNARHVVLNVDVKLDNDPDQLFGLMKDIIESYEGWKEDLAPRLILGFWHAKYIEPGQRILPYCRRAHIGVSPSIARKYFWTACSGFSLNFSCLVGREGEAFRKACREEGKELYIWTVNSRKEMITATRWGANAILTDRTADYLKVRGEIKNNWSTISSEVPWSHSWSSIYYFTPVNSLYMAWETFLLHRVAGPMLPAQQSATVIAGKMGTVDPAKVVVVEERPARSDTSVQ